eukprot:5373401-Amphidinium_carterae.1
MLGFPYHLLRDQAVLQQLETENVAAKAAGCVAGSYIDLTSKDFFLVGGPRHSRALHLLLHLVSWVGPFRRPHKLRVSFETHPIRSACHRYSLMAVAMGKVIRAASKGHPDAIFKLLEDERHTSGSFRLAI